MDTRPSGADLITYAKLMRRVNWPFAPVPEGWMLVEFKKHRLTGFNAGVFRRKATGEIAVGIKGVQVWDLRDLIAVPIKRTFGYPRSTLRYAKSVLERFGPRVTFIGHSGGGGVASWLGHELGRPSVTFNSGRTRASLLNDGRRQVNVCVRGDRWGDPWNGLYGMKLAGEYIVLDPPPRARRIHFIRAVIEALELRYAGDTSKQGRT